jgi:hypothetical protein
VPLLRAPQGIEANRPLAYAEREFVRNLGLTFLHAKGRPPFEVDFDAPGPFSRFVHRCFELVGAPSGYVTELINDVGRERRRAYSIPSEPPGDFGAFLDKRAETYAKISANDLSPDRRPKRVRRTARSKTYGRPR